jgi:hypothetical protein
MDGDPLMAMRPRPVRWIRWLVIAISCALWAALASCVSVTYQKAGASIAPRPGEALVFGRLRFFHDGREYFPWKPDVVSALLHSELERHVWLLRLGRRAVSTELHPDADGSLAIWLAPADYALLGSTTKDVTSGPGAYEVVALLRVPGGQAAAYTGDLLMKTQWHEGVHRSRGEFGVKTVEQQPIEIARAALEQRLGRLPDAPVISPWCTGDDLPAFDDPDLATRARELLDRGCATVR